MADPVLAVDIGGTTTRGALVEGTLLRPRREMPTRAEEGPDALIRRLLNLVAGVCPGSGAVGVACTGRVHEGLVMAVNAATMPGWKHIPQAHHGADAGLVGAALFTGQQELPA